MASKIMNICNLPMDGSALFTKMTGVRKDKSGEAIEKLTNPKLELKRRLQMKLKVLKSQLQSIPGGKTATGQEQGQNPPST